jgi:hypothetical protein
VNHGSSVTSIDAAEPKYRMLLQPRLEQSTRYDGVNNEKFNSIGPNGGLRVLARLAVAAGPAFRAGTSLH